MGTRADMSNNRESCWRAGAYNIHVRRNLEGGFLGVLAIVRQYVSLGVEPRGGEGTALHQATLG